MKSILKRTTLKKGFQTNIKNNPIITDFEGYPYNNKFYFKEISIFNLNENSIRNFFIKSPLKFNKTIYYLSKYHHKIPISYGNCSHHNVFNIINQSSVIYCKSLDKINILKKFTKILIKDIYSPPLTQLPTHLFMCSFHADNNQHCALKKVIKLYKWLNSSKILVDKKIC
jgi:hypothetical protein